jgi:STE24 endopeptidase
MNESKAARYQRYRRRAESAGVVSGAAMLALLALTPLSRWLSAGALGFGVGLPELPRAGLALVIFVVLIVVAWELAVLPAMLYLGLRVDRRFANSSIAVEDVLAAQAHATLVALPAALVAGIALMLSVWMAGAWWWALAGALLAGALVAALHGAPRLLARLADVRPLARADLAARLNGLAARAQVPVRGVEEMQLDDADRTTAMVAGAGRSRRIFVSSELLRAWSDDEIAVVVAHELGHHAHRDLWRTLALDASVLAVALFVADRALGWAAPALALAGPRDLAALPFLTLVAGAVWVLLTPLRYAHSRLQERRADDFALALTGASEAFSSAIRRLGARHLVDDRPSILTRWLFHRHPTLDERLARAGEYQRTIGGR